VPRLLSASALRTLDASEASLFYVPLYHKCISTVLEKNTTGITQFYDLAIREIARYWHATSFLLLDAGSACAPICQAAVVDSPKGQGPRCEIASVCCPLALTAAAVAVFLFPGGLGVSEYLNWRSTMPLSTILSPEASYSSPAIFLAPYFDADKDIVIPGYQPPAHWLQLVSNSLPLAERPILVSYHGNRPQL
jgi:hypothetical protein